MHTIELLEQAVRLADQLGYQVRQEWLGGCAGGACEVAGRKLIFLDSSLNVTEQLEQILGALAEDPGVHAVETNETMETLLGLRRAA